MKCINKTLLGLLAASCMLASAGCGSKPAKAVFSNAYDIYNTSKDYGLIAEDDTSIQNTTVFFAGQNCVSDGSDLGIEKTSSYVAGAAGVFNLNTKEIPYAQNIYGKMYPASTTKILTAYTALKYGNLDEVFTVSENAVNQEPDSSVCHLKAGDRLTLRQLLYGLMLQSGNDAAVAIAEGVSGSVEAFAKLMNEEANALGATDSHFVNPNGLHDTEHYTTVYDLYLLFSAAVKDDAFRELIRTAEYTADYQDALGMPMQQIWHSTNKYLLGTEDIPNGLTVIGGKTGTTNDAGYCLVLLSQNAAGEEIVSIVMKADCRNNLYYYMNELLRGFSGGGK